MQKCKEAKKVKRVAQSKQGKHSIIAWSGERYVSNTPTLRRCVSQVVTSNKPQEGWMQPHKQMALKTNKHKPTKGTKHGKAEI